MKTVDTIFFDLDHTLWDFETNARNTILEIFEIYELGKHIKNVDSFIARYNALNHHYWSKFNKGEITADQLRQQRIEHVFYTFGIEDRTLGMNFVEHFQEHGPTKSALMPNALEVVKTLANKYKLAIITNGFDETQHTKIEASGLKPYFPIVITSDSFGIRKPNKLIFNKALELTNATSENALMVGDDLNSDYLGPKKAGWNALFYNPESSSKKYSQKDLKELVREEKITCLSEIPKLLRL